MLIRLTIKTCLPDINEFGNTIFQALSKIDPLNTFPPNILASTLTPFIEYPVIANWFNSKSFVSDKIEISGFKLLTEFWEINFSFFLFWLRLGDCIILVALIPSVSIIATIGTVSLLLSILIAIASFETIIFLSNEVILKANIWSPSLNGFSVTITNSPILSDKVFAIIFPFDITFNSEFGRVFPAIRTSPSGFTRIVC